MAFTSALPTSFVLVRQSSTRGLWGFISPTTELMLQFKGASCTLTISIKREKEAIGVCVRLSPYLFTRAIQAQSTKQSNRLNNFDQRFRRPESLSYYTQVSIDNFNSKYLFSKELY
jgi:hypothetical protein